MEDAPEFVSIAATLPSAETGSFSGRSDWLRHGERLMGGACMSVTSGETLFPSWARIPLRLGTWTEVRSEAICDRGMKVSVERNSDLALLLPEALLLLPDVGGGFCGGLECSRGVEGEPESCCSCRSHISLSDVSS